MWQDIPIELQREIVARTDMRARVICREWCAWAPVRVALDVYRDRPLKQFIDIVEYFSTSDKIDLTRVFHMAPDYAFAGGDHYNIRLATRDCVLAIQTSDPTATPQIKWIVRYTRGICTIEIIMSETMRAYIWCEGNRTMNAHLWPLYSAVSRTPCMHSRDMIDWIRTRIGA